MPAILVDLSIYQHLTAPLIPPCLLSSPHEKPLTTQTPQTRNFEPAQVRECAVALKTAATERGYPLFLSAHVTKDNEIAGPKARFPHRAPHRFPHCILISRIPV